jgi:hypothetical protein
MAISQAMCTSFKVELMQGIHNFNLSGGDNFKIALYSSGATLGAGTTAYSASDEITGTGYDAGGKSLTRVDPTSASGTAFADFADISWPGASFTTRGALIYNATDGNRAVCVLDFGSEKTVSDGTFTIQFPAADAGSAIIRIG